MLHSRPKSEACTAGICLSSKAEEVVCHCHSERCSVGQATDWHIVQLSRSRLFDIVEEVGVCCANSRLAVSVWNPAGALALVGSARSAPENSMLSGGSASITQTRCRRQSRPSALRLLPRHSAGGGKRPGSLPGQVEWYNAPLLMQVKPRVQSSVDARALRSSQQTKPIFPQQHSQVDHLAWPPQRSERQSVSRAKRRFPTFKIVPARAARGIC